MKTPTLALALALGFSGLASAALPPAISGAWYNPAQSGHGITLEVIDDQRAIAFWYVYDAQGNPIHLYIDGAIKGHTVAGTAYLSRGMRFGSFDPATHTIGVWGQVSLDFSDCTHATLRYDANGPRGGAAFGTGTIAMTRLTELNGLDCQLSDSARLPVGLYQASYADSGEANIPLAAAVDPDGVFWATSSRPAQGPIASGAQDVRPVVTGAVSVGGAANVLRAEVVGNVAFSGRVPVTGARGDVALDGNTGSGTFADAWFKSLRLNPDAARNVAIARDLNLADLDGRVFDAALIGESAADAARVRVDGRGALCISVASQDASAQCTYSGQIAAAFPGWTFFAFKASRRGDDLGTPYSGRGWVEYAQGRPERVVLIGDDTRGDGLGLVATGVAR